MRLTFFGSSQDTNAVEVKTKGDLLALLKSFPERRPFFCELFANNGYKLLVGVKGTLGCAQYSAIDGDPPYLVAVTPFPYDADGQVEFLMEDEPTAIIARYCLPFDKLKD